MATLENIRKRGPLVAAVIGIALLAFILGDLFNSGGGLFSGDRFRIAEVNGENIDYRDYENQVQSAIENYKNSGRTLTDSERDQVREMVWDNMVQGILLENEYQAIGVLLAVMNYLT